MSIFGSVPEDDIAPDEPMEAWIEIQRTTFTNWVNEKLRVDGVGVADVRRDFRDGQKLCTLMKVLTKKPLAGRVITGRRKGQELNHYEASGNLALALDTMEKDGVRLVNIGAEDIRSGNLKLILGMIWTLIRKYQIGSSGKSLPKKLMLEWINAVLHPHLTVYNFSTDWNDGKALQGVIEWCRPGTFPQWMNLNLSDKEKNCEDAITTAERVFKIPIVVSAKHLSSPDLDELSGMTYISYYMHEGEDGVREMGRGERSCGYEATLNWANSFLMNVAPESRTTNFDTDWNDGFRACALIESLAGAGTIPGFPNISRSNHAYTCEMAMIAAEKHGVISKPWFISPHDMADPKVDHLGPMAYVAWHRKLEKERPAPPPPAPVPVPVVAPVPTFTSPPEVDVTVPPQWRVHSTYTLMADTYRVGPGVVTATCISPSGLHEDLNARKTDNNKYDLPFNPQEKGRYLIKVFYDGTEVRGSPFPVNVYDISYAKIIRTQFGPIQPKEAYMFQVDISQVGYDDLDIYIMHTGQKQQFDLRNNGNGFYDVRFFPQEMGGYTSQVFCGGEQIPGSPFDLECVPKGNVLARGEGLRQAFTRRVARFEVDTSEFKGQTVEVKLFSPSGRMLRVEMNRDPQNPDVYIVTYYPDEVGTHQVEIFYADGPIPGCPFYVNVRDPQVYVRNLDHRCVKNRQSHFLIDASEFEEGTVAIDSALPVMKYEKVGDKLYEVTLLPQRAGNYDLQIDIDGKEVRGSPFDVDVTDE